MTIHVTVNLAQVLAICFVIVLAVALIYLLGGAVVVTFMDAPRPIQPLLVFAVVCVVGVTAYTVINVILGNT